MKILANSVSYLFGQFELDESTRALRLDGSEIPLQPRVFDLLCLLYRNRSRVMSKEELMDTLWPGVIVGEGSLQRAVSLARSALKQGNLGNAIRNYTRQGYRLCLDEAEPCHESHAETELLATARAAHEIGDWDAAVAAFEKADTKSALDAADLERLADSHQCNGQAEAAERVLERAAVAFAARGDVRGAARATLRLAEIAFESGRIAIAKGWLARADRHLQSCQEGWEHGFAAYVTARIAVATGDPEEAARSGRRGVSIAARIKSEEIEALAKLYLGYGEIALGHIREGITLVDESAATVLSGEVGRRAGGIIYCGLIWLCCNRGDWQRAAEWANRFDRWCQRERMTRFSGLCQLHRAEVLSVSGDARQAEREIQVACDRLMAFSPFAAGDAFRILGDLKLMQGDYSQADEAFRRAHDLGWDPQPGLAMLQAERGESASAIRGLLRSLDDNNWALRQRRGLLLATLAVIAARHGDRDRAICAIEELDAHPELWASDYNNSAVACAHSELALLDGERERAITAMREAIRSWQAAHAHLNTAICRFRLAELLAMDGDVAGALLELDAAEASFDTLQALSRAKACLNFRSALTEPNQQARNQ